jgi:hypothetical protein
MKKVVEIVAHPDVWQENTTAGSKIGEIYRYPFSKGRTGEPRARFHLEKRGGIADNIITIPGEVR